MASVAQTGPGPLLVPDRDVTVEYQVIPQDHAPVEVRVAISAGGRFLHITSPDLPTTILVNRNTEMAAILLPVLRMYADIRIARYDPEQTILRGASFTRGSDRVLGGRRCTDWRAVSHDGHAEACISPDGVILRGTAASDRKGALGAIRAGRVVYGPLAPEMFRIPADFQKSPVPIDPEGLGQ
jgi:hypothetical protein